MCHLHVYTNLTECGAIVAGAVAGEYRVNIIDATVDADAPTATDSNSATRTGTYRAPCTSTDEDASFSDPYP
ncbi:MAG: hypothetical protein F4148_16785 [Caldilineaceae bacterium SB0675_bin_29]|uniref:Uncharacterized protein n=1 Tax=Caldilineaceae bacterium SB0675_bin_29 TaxID=2605266 RepID=A0A6B1G326_9CHLR|nr:hypothetical protein [Caldilineaceae bacterium SB0675_bin_29]